MNSALIQLFEPNKMQEQETVKRVRPWTGKIKPELKPINVDIKHQSEVQSHNDTAPEDRQSERSAKRKFGQHDMSFSNIAPAHAHIFNSDQPSLFGP
jgi:hypothetical protein